MSPWSKITTLVFSCFLLLYSAPSRSAEARYEYDDLGRLIRVERADCTVVTYTYDAVGNRLSKSVAVDQDCDTVRDTLDCAPADGGAFAPPGEVSGLLFPDKTTLSWGSAAPGAGSDTVHDVSRGLLAELPVGSGAAETCVAPGIPDAFATDSSSPDPGTGYWYLVRGRNVCGTGTYGTETGGSERSTAVCP
jgi:YD repeat-containing protein